MKRAFLLKTIIALFVGLFAQQATAQNASIMGIRLIVNASAPTGGVKRFTYSSSSTTTAWGRALDSTWRNVPLVLAAPDAKACGTLNAIGGNSWVLIERGDCEFGAKALAAQNQGAKGVIIYNNIANSEPIGMAAGASGGGVKIPVLMVSNDDGLAMKAAISAGPLTISLTKWGFNLNNDLCIVPVSAAGGPNGAMPVAQLASGTPNAYKFYTGAFIANTGNSKATNIKLKQTTTFTPTGGSASVLFSDSATAATFNVIDSIIEVFSNKSNSSNQTALGRYDVTYTVSSDSTDQNPSDNTMTTTMYVTPNVFCKGDIDPVAQNPRATIGYRLNTGNPFAWGPLFYVNKGGMKADKVKLLVNDNDTTRHALNASLNAFIFKWIDGSNGGTSDGFMQSRELSLKSIAGRTLGSLDSNGQALTITCGDSNGIAGTVVLEDNSYYWVAVDVPQNWFLSCDGNANYYNRTNAAQNFVTPKSNEFWAPLYPGAVNQLQSAATDTVRNIPFGVTNATSNTIDSVAYAQVAGVVPAVALFTGLFPESVKNAKGAAEQVVVYPNPASTVINADIKLLDGKAPTYIRVVDAMGRRIADVADINQSKISINTSAFASGTYYLLIGTENSVLTRTFSVVNK